MLKHTSCRKLIVLLVGVVVASASVRAQTTWYVDDDAPNDPGPGDPLVSDPMEDGSEEHPFDAIEEGITVSSNGDTVLVLNGTYVGTGNKNLDFNGKTITVRSENGPEACIIDCEEDGRGFYSHPSERSDFLVDGFTITNGYVDNASPGGEDGGGIYCHSNGVQDATIRNCTISDNTAEAGGGVYGEPLMIIDCTISGNTADQYGGGLNVGDNYSPVRIIDCTISGNSAELGGGIYARESTVVTNCRISENIATGLLAGDGGGVYVYGYGPSILANCVIDGNIAMNDGGGIYCGLNAHVSLINNTISNNFAAFFGGALVTSTSTVEAAMRNCIFWGNAAAIGPEVAQIGGETRVAYCDVQGGEAGVYVYGGLFAWGWGNIETDPAFADPNNADFHLLPGSPCIDAGDNDSLPLDDFDLDGDGDPCEPLPIDFDGWARQQDDPDTPDTGNGEPPIVDMGAYEFGDAPPTLWCFGDLDGDQDADLTDLAILLSHYGTLHGATRSDGDLDCDNDVDLADLAALLTVYGTTCE